MQTDLYTKAMLTIIAACLIWLCTSGAVVPAVRAESTNQVYLAGWVDRAGYVKKFPPSGNENPAPLPVRPTQ